MDSSCLSVLLRVTAMVLSLTELAQAGDEQSTARLEAAVAVLEVR